MDHCPPPENIPCIIIKNGVAVGQNDNCTWVYKCTADGTDAIAKIVLKPVTEAKQMLEELERVK